MWVTALRGSKEPVVGWHEARITQALRRSTVKSAFTTSQGATTMSSETLPTKTQQPVESERGLLMVLLVMVLLGVAGVFLIS